MNDDEDPPTPQQELLQQAREINTQLRRIAKALEWATASLIIIAMAQIFRS